MSVTGVVNILAPLLSICLITCYAVSSMIRSHERYEKIMERYANERTCHLNFPIVDWETGETDYVCSECGFSADPQDWAERYTYCPSCGAKVI